MAQRVWKTHVRSDLQFSIDGKPTVLASISIKDDGVTQESLREAAQVLWENVENLNSYIVESDNKLNTSKIITTPEIVNKLFKGDEIVTSPEVKRWIDKQNSWQKVWQEKVAKERGIKVKTSDVDVKLLKVEAKNLESEIGNDNMRDILRMLIRIETSKDASTKISEKEMAALGKLKEAATLNIIRNADTTVSISDNRSENIVGYVDYFKDRGTESIKKHDERWFVENAVDFHKKNQNSTSLDQIVSSAREIQNTNEHTRKAIEQYKGIHQLLKPFEEARSKQTQLG